MYIKGIGYCGTTNRKIAAHADINLEQGACACVCVCVCVCVSPCLPLSTLHRRSRAEELLEGLGYSDAVSAQSLLKDRRSSLGREQAAGSGRERGRV